MTTRNSVVRRAPRAASPRRRGGGARVLRRLAPIGGPGLPRTATPARRSGRTAT